MEILTKKVEELGEQGLVDEAQLLLDQIETLKTEKETYELKLPTTRDQTLIVCSICCASLSSNESDQRLADHFAGKAHLGYQKMRDKLDLLNKAREEKEKEREIQKKK